MLKRQLAYWQPLLLPEWRVVLKPNQSTKQMTSGGVAIGAVEKKTFRVITGERPRPVIHFRYIDKGKKK